MQRLHALNKTSKHILNFEIQTFCKFYSNKPAIKIQENQPEEIQQHLKKLSQIKRKIKLKQPQKPPFAKNLFLGIFDTDLLTYPQLESDEFKQLNEDILPVENCFTNLTPQSNLSNDFIDMLRHLNLFGIQSSELQGGRELSTIETCRFNEVLCSQTSTVPGLLCNEYLGIQALERAGSEAQKNKYLSELINGNILSAFCMAENQKALSTFDTVAELNKDKTAWILNGTKTGVLNASTAGLFIVVAKTSVIDRKGLRESKLTSFLVEKDSAGITVQSNSTLGISGADVCEVTFTDTLIPIDNVLGTPHAGDAVVSSLLTQFRLSSGPACTTLMRKILNNLVDYCKDVNIGKVSIADADYVQSVIAKIAISLYATESITYLTAGLIDQYENQDCLMESSIVKAFASNEAYISALRAMDIMGTPTYMHDHWCNLLFRDALSYKYLNEVTENFKIWIALLGLQHTGKVLQGDITKARNPLFHAKDVFKKMWNNRKHVRDDPDLKLRLADYVHPSLDEPARWLEYCVVRLQYATEVVLARYGNEVSHQHMELTRLAECVIAIYVMSACLGRASRSYCIGLRNANYEMMVASTYCLNTMQEVKEKINKVCNGPYSSSDESYKTIAKRIFKDGKYSLEHPLARNF